MKLTTVELCYLVLRVVETTSKYTLFVIPEYEVDKFLCNFMYEMNIICLCLINRYETKFTSFDVIGSVCIDCIQRLADFWYFEYFPFNISGYYICRFAYYYINDLSFCFSRSFADNFAIQRFMNGTFLFIFTQNIWFTKILPAFSSFVFLFLFFSLPHRKLIENEAHPGGDKRFSDAFQSSGF